MLPSSAKAQAQLEADLARPAAPGLVQGKLPRKLTLCIQTSYNPTGNEWLKEKEPVEIGTQMSPVEGLE